MASQSEGEQVLIHNMMIPCPTTIHIMRGKTGEMKGKERRKLAGVEMGEFLLIIMMQATKELVANTTSSHENTCVIVSRFLSILGEHISLEQKCSLRFIYYYVMIVHRTIEQGNGFPRRLTQWRRVHANHFLRPSMMKHG